METTSSLVINTTKLQKKHQICAFCSLVGCETLLLFILKFLSYIHKKTNKFVNSFLGFTLKHFYLSFINNIISTGRGQHGNEQHTSLFRDKYYVNLEMEQKHNKLRKKNQGKN